MLKLYKNLSGLIYEFARKNYGVGRDVFGISLPSPYAGITKLICDNIGPTPEQIFEANALPPNQYKSEGSLPLNEYAGKLVKFEMANLTSKKIANEDDARKAEIIVNPGLGGGDSLERLHSTLSEFRRLFPQKELAIYSPLNEGKNRSVRHARGALYYVNQNSINEEESANFFDKVIKPKITDESGKFLPPEDCKKFLLANFSIGCREAESHFRFFLKQLRKNGLSEDVARKYLNQIAILNVASPRNWDQITEQPYTLSIISLDDAGSKKPPQFLLDFYLNAKFHSQEQKISKIIRPFPGDKKEMLVIMDPGIITCGGVRKESGPFIPNPLGHNLANHIDGILKNSELSQLIKSFDFFLDRPISDRDFLSFKKDLFSGASDYRENFENPSEEDMMALFESWFSYQEREIAARKNSPFTSRFLQKTAQSESACSNKILPFLKGESDIFDVSLGSSEANNKLRDR